MAQNPPRVAAVLGHHLNYFAIMQTMIIASTKPFTADEIPKLLEEFPDLIKTAIDIEKKICAAGANRHFECAEVLIAQGSSPKDIWGGGVDTETKEITIDSMINIRPADNRSNQIQDPATREKFEKLSRFFFPTIFNDER